VTIDDIQGNDLHEFAYNAHDIIFELAEAATDQRLDEALLFLRFRKEAQKLLRSYDIEFTDSTFGGKSTT
jgi:hypothetical protein